MAFKAVLALYTILISIGKPVKIELLNSASIEGIDSWDWDCKIDKVMWWRILVGLNGTMPVLQKPGLKPLYIFSL